jgi:hypothetical protein
MNTDSVSDPGRVNVVSTGMVVVGGIVVVVAVESPLHAATRTTAMTTVATLT